MRVSGSLERGPPRAAQRAPGNKSTLLHLFGPFVLDPAAHRLTCDGRPVAVPTKAWQILLMLVEARGCLVTHEAFRASLWPNVRVEDRTLTVHVSTLRKVLGDGSSCDVVETVFGAGYRLAVPVRVAKPAELPTPATDWPSSAARLTASTRSFARSDLGETEICRSVGGLVDLAGAGNTAEVSRMLGVERLLERMVRCDAEPLQGEARLFDMYRPRAMQADILQLQARAHLRSFARLPLLKALSLFEQALALDPDCAMAHAGLASTYLLMASTAMLRPLQVDEAMPMARRAAQRAIALDEGLPEAWAALGRVKMEYDWDWEGAEADLAHAVALNGSSVEALATFGQFLSAMGRHDEAIEAMEQARRLDPRSVETLQHLAIVYWMAGQGERALEAVDDSLKAAPGSPRAHYGRMMILDQLGRRDEAMAERLTTLRGLPVAQGVAEHVDALARSRGWREAMEVWIALLERTNRWEGAAQQWMAAGESSRALDALEHCVKARTTYLCFTAQNPYFRPLHNNPRFQRILQILKLDSRTGRAGL